MTFKKCTLCETPINEDNDSEEHIFANAVGGWSTVKKFICVECNNKKGKTWDAELARQFAWLSLMAGIKRDRGEVQPVVVKTASGIEYRMRSDGSMEPHRFKFSRDSVGEQVKISFVARNFDEVNTKLSELKKKYPQMNIEEARESAKMTTTYLDEPLVGSLPEGGADVGRSIIMTALAYASEQGIDPACCELVLPFLRSPNEVLETRYGWSYLTDSIKNRKAGKIFHCISLFGNPEMSKLFAYVELFSYGRWHIALSDQYIGPMIQTTYAIDPSEAQEINIEVDWKGPLARIEEVLIGNGFDSSNVLKAMDSLMPELMGRSSQRAYTVAFENALKNVLDSMGLTMESIISPELLQVISGKIIEQMMPFFRKQRSLKRLSLSSDMN